MKMWFIGISDIPLNMGLLQEKQKVTVKLTFYSKTKLGGALDGAKEKSDAVSDAVNDAVSGGLIDVVNIVHKSDAGASINELIKAIDK